MEQTANAEKQARYRKKDKLRRLADQVFRQWQLEPKKDNLRNETDIHQLIESVIKLPHRWTDNDYLNAEKKLYHLHSEILSPKNQILNDVQRSKGISFISDNNDMQKLMLEKAVERTTDLASHIISAFKISDCDESEQAAALMEAMRFLGRTFSSNKTTCYPSEAIAMCLATIDPVYDRPKWFARDFSFALYKQIQPEFINEIMEYFKKYEEQDNDNS